ncbi:hypothetical protein EGW08_010875, partial [Elysia chlorotica]
ATFLGGNFTADNDTEENCLSISTRQKYWFNVDCSMELPFICQKLSFDALSAPVMEMKPRYADVSAGSQPRKQNVYFVGDQVNVTCRALRVPSGKLVWTFQNKDGSPSQDFPDLDKFTDNIVETIIHENMCVHQTVSTFSTAAVKEMTTGYLSCYSVRYPTDPPCSDSGDPLEFCVRSHQFKVLEAPYKGPDLRITFSEPPATVIESETLVAECEVYPVEDGSLVWMILHPNGTSRVLENNTNPEITLATSTEKEGKRVIASRLEMTVEKAFDGSRIACFSYNISKSDTQECRASDTFCAISPTIH